MADINDSASQIQSVQKIIKSFVDTMKSVEKIDKKSMDRSIHAVSDASQYLKRFIVISNDITTSIMSSNNLNEKIIKSQLDAVKLIKDTMDIVKDMCDIKLPNTISYMVKLERFKFMFDRMMHTFFDPKRGIASYLQKISKGGEVETTDKKGKSKKTKLYNIDEFKKFVDNFTSIVESVQNIIKDTEDLSKKTLTSDAIIRRAFKTLVGTKKKPGIFDLYKDLLSSESLKVLSYKKSLNTLKGAEATIRAFNSIVSAISEIGIGALIGTFKASLLLNTIIINVHKVIVQIIEFSEEISQYNIQDITEPLDTIKRVIWSMLGLIGGIALLALATPVVILAAPIALIGTLAIAAFVKLWVIELNWISNKRSLNDITVAAINLVKIVAAIVGAELIAAVGMLLLAEVGMMLVKVWKAALFTTLAISAVVIGIAGLAWLISKLVSNFGTTIYIGLLVIVALIGILLIAAGAVLLLAYIGALFIEYKLWIPALLMIGLVVAVTTAIGGLGYLLGLMLPGVAAALAGIAMVTLAITAILLIAGELLLLAQISFTKDQRDRIKANVALIGQTARDVMNAVFNGLGADGEIKETEDSPFVRFFKSLFKGASFIVEALASSLVLVMTVVSVSMILLIAGELLLLKQIDNSSIEGAKDNVRTVISTAREIILRCMDDAPEGNAPARKGLGGLIAKAFPGLMNVIDGVMSFAFMATAFAAVGMITIIAKDLEYLQGIQLNKEGILQKVGDVFAVSKQVIDVANNKDYDIKKDRIKNARRINRLLNIIRRSADNINKIGETGDKQGFNKTIDNYVRFVEKINSADVSNLETTTNLFAKMAEFSNSINGNFDGLADALNEKIAPLLEELKDLMDGLPGKIKEASSSFQFNGGYGGTGSGVLLQGENPEAGSKTPAAPAAQLNLESLNTTIGNLKTAIDDVLKAYDGQTMVIRVQNYG